MKISLPFLTVPVQINSQLPKQSHYQAEVVDQIPGMMVVKFHLTINGETKVFQYTLTAYDTEPKEQANWFAASNLLRFYRRLARTMQLRAQLHRAA